jgi:uncharacterized protein YcbK (DUF882 family)
MGDLTRDFSRSKFACRCGCGFDSISEILVAKLQLLRNALGVPIIINSGCRCQKHNEAIGGAKLSYHTLGLAADIAIPKTPITAGINLKTFFFEAEKIGFYGLGYYPEQNFLHVDEANKIRRWTKRNGVYQYWL